MVWFKGIIGMSDRTINSYFSLKESIPEDRAHPFIEKCERISYSRKVLNISKPSFKDRGKIKIALISLRLAPSLKQKLQKHYSADVHNCPDIDDDACLRQMIRWSEEDSDNLYSNFESALEIACTEHQSDIVCINELGYPSRGYINELGYPSRGCIPEERARTLAKSMANAKDHKCVIIGGTCHDIRTRLNSGYVFYPGCENRHTYGIPFHKQISATHEGEFISTPPRRKSLLFNFYGLRVGVIVCLDLMDFSTIGSIVKENGDTINLLMVPACVKFTNSMERAAQIISEAMGGLIAIVNFCRGREPSSYIYLFGKEAENSEYISYLSNETTFPWGALTLFEVNRNQLMEGKVECITNLSDDLVWLFDRQPIESV